MAPFTWIIIAFLGAVVVLGIGVLSSATGSGQFLADLRAWRRREPGATGLHPMDVRRELAEMDEGTESVDTLFDIGEQPDDAYLDLVAVMRRRTPAPDRLLG